MEAKLRMRRPAEVTVVVVLTYLSALASIVLGVLLILARYLVDEADTTARAFVTITGSIVVLMGFLTVAVASGIARGDKTARTLATVLLAISAALSLLTLFIDAEDLWVQFVNVAINGGVIAVLWTGRARTFFERASA
jgi:hypothetical protein